MIDIIFGIQSMVVSRILHTRWLFLPPFLQLPPFPSTTPLSFNVVARITTHLKHCHATKFVVAGWKNLLKKVDVSSTCCNMLPQLATTKFCCVTMFEVGGNTCNNAFQLATQQCCVKVEETCCPYYWTFSIFIIKVQWSLLAFYLIIAYRCSQTLFSRTHSYYPLYCIKQRKVAFPPLWQLHVWGKHVQFPTP